MGPKTWDILNDAARTQGIKVAGLGNLDMDVVNSGKYCGFARVFGRVVPWSKLKVRKYKVLTTTMEDVREEIKEFLRKNRSKIGFVHEILPIRCYTVLGKEEYQVGTVVCGWIKGRKNAKR